MRTIDLNIIPEYELISKEMIADLGSEGYLLKHKKTGARVVLLNNDDNNKVFYIGFRTTPVDSTGVMHILEHSVLCGSKEFPVKDPFIELAKGSLNTFLNAMTYPDKTVYPVASTNDKDFQNLIHVYLDAVFRPNILNSDKTFKQEGWHYEMESAEDDLTINGVVYNEMKGAFSSPDDVLEREIFNSLFPDTTYGNESGGDPKNIPDLTYEHYIETYKKYYHPSNSYIYLYGDMDMVEKLKFIDEHYLSEYDQIEVDSEVQIQSVFEQQREVKKHFSITESEPLEENTYISYNTAMESNLNELEYIALQMVDYALCSAPGAILKQTMLDRNIGKDIYSYYDNGVRQPYFSIVAKNSDECKKQLFLDTIKEVLVKIVKEGFDKDTLRGAVNVLEFKYREADFGSYPPGLMYGLQVFDSWLYDDEKPFIHIAAGETYKKLRELVETDYFENLVERCLLNNNHKSIVIIVPEVGLVEKEEALLSSKLAQYKASLSKNEIDEIVKETAQLKAYQDEEDSPEDLASIPVLELSDIKKEAAGFDNEVNDVEGVKSLYHEIDTHGIDYFRFIFDVTNIPKNLYKYLGILKSTIGLVDTENYSYGELYNKINIHTGGISNALNLYTDINNSDDTKVTFDWKVKTLKGGLDIAFDLLWEMMYTSNFDDEKRNRELVAEMKSHIQGTMMSSGHHVASGRLGTYFSKSSVLSDVISGYGNYKLVEKLDAKYDECKDEIKKNLSELVKVIFNKNNLMVDFAGDRDEYNYFNEKVSAFIGKMQEFNAANVVENDGKKFEAVCEVRNEGIMSSSQVNYVCRGGNFIKKGLKYTGALRVLRVIMSYDYLWMNVRVKNGAYGCMSAFGKSGDGYFVSYRDPNLAKTLEVYQGVVDYVANYEADERSMTQYIIGAISELDTPLTPANKALRSLAAYMTNLSKDFVQRERDEILGADVKSIQELSSHMKAILEDNYVCVVGNEEAIKAENERFMNLENMFEG